MTDLTFIIPVFFIVGIIVGMLTMIYGSGGGTLLVPLIYSYLAYTGASTTIAMKVAVGTSMLTVFISTLSVSYKHFKSKNIYGSVIIQIIPPLLIGILSGLYLAHYCQGKILKIIFISFLLIVIANDLFKKSLANPPALDDFKMPPKSHLRIAGFTVGMISILVGVGGGILIVPYLRHLRMTMLCASATSACIAMVTSFCGSIGYLYLGMHTSYQLPPYTLGYVNIAMLITILVGSFIGIHIGQRLSLRLSEQTRAKYFPFLIITTILFMIK